MAYSQNFFSCAFSRYKFNEFAADATKLGVLPNMKLTRREWSMIRRGIHGRPRRFSRRFIFSQLKKRNRYRLIARHLQRNPSEPNPTGFDIPPPIKPGTIVTAFNQKFKTLHRGVVLFHDAAGHRYLVQFERELLGVEFCVDTEVASHGISKVLVPGKEVGINGVGFGEFHSHLLELDTLKYGTHRSIPTYGKFGSRCELRRLFSHDHC